MYPDSAALHRAAYRALRAALAIPEPEASARILRAYTDQPFQDPGPGETVCFFHLHTDPAPALYRETSVTASVPEVFDFVPCALTLVFCGPSCESWAHRAQYFLFLDGAGNPRQILRASGLYLIPPAHPPSVLWEEDGNTYRKRADVTIQARLRTNTPYASALTEAPAAVPTVETPPQVLIH